MWHWGDHTNYRIYKNRGCKKIGVVSMGSRGLRPLVGCGAKPRIAEQSSAVAQTNSHAQKNRQKPKKKNLKKPPHSETQNRNYKPYGVCKIGSVRVRRLNLHISTEKSGGDSRCECGHAEAAPFFCFGAFFYSPYFFLQDITDIPDQSHDRLISAP